MVGADLPGAGVRAVGPLGSGWIRREAVWSRLSYCSNQAPLQPVTPTPAHLWVPEQGPPLP